MPVMPSTFRPSNAPSRIEQRREYDRKRDEQDWRGWYKTADWQRLKHRVHVRDRFVCQVTGVLCIGKHPAPNSPVADHIEEHNGDPALFWDLNNIRTVSKEYHDGQRQREQNAARREGGGRKSSASRS